MDPELREYLDSRFAETQQKFTEEITAQVGALRQETGEQIGALRRETGVLIEAVRDDVRGVAEAVAMVDAKLDRHIAQCDESLAALDRRVTRLEAQNLTGTT